ncbi:hypothetical protein GALL_290160 [mine drainage metagenome]|uniref:Uncharacterized protein n=1 Tax=mine drainage metagenome TaxID=410659 RepID=A0A1J5RAQ4_9ZZZZ
MSNATIAPLDLARTTFLLGSGISIPSGYPSTGDLTKELLSKNWSHDRDQAKSTIPVESPLYCELYSLRIEAIKGLIRLLKSHIEQHLALLGKGEPTYEDIYYLARQLLDSLMGEYDNPGLLPLMSDLRDKVVTMTANLNAAYGHDNILNPEQNHGLQDLLNGCLEFIEESVAAQLSLRTPIKGLQLLDECRSKSEGTTLHIATLNHDTMLEAHFSSTSFSDGFVLMGEGTSMFSPESFSTTNATVQLLKLHGSVNWYQYKSRGGPTLSVKVTTADKNHIKDPANEDLLLPESRLLLAGTNNKELAYGAGIFLELMFQFQRRLKETRYLIVSGYGFGDKGINNRIWAWIDSHRDNRLILLHADVSHLSANAKPSLRLNSNRLKAEGRLVFVDKWLCDCSIEDIKRELRFSARDSG